MNINAANNIMYQDYNSYIIGNTLYDFDPYTECALVMQNLSIGTYTYELKARYIKPAYDIERQDVWICTKCHSLMTITWYTNGDVTSSTKNCEHNY